MFFGNDSQFWLVKSEIRPIKTICENSIWSWLNTDRHKFLCIHCFFFYLWQKVCNNRYCNKPPTELLVLISGNLFEENTSRMAFYWNKLMTWYSICDREIKSPEVLIKHLESTDQSCLKQELRADELQAVPTPGSNSRPTGSLGHYKNSLLKIKKPNNDSQSYMAKFTTLNTTE